MPTKVRSTPGGARAIAHVEAVHRVGEQRVGCAVHAIDERVALMIEVALDVEAVASVAVALTIVAFAQEIVALIGEHRDLARERNAALRIERDRFALHGVERDAHRGVMIACADHDCMADTLRGIQRQLQCLHPAERTADHDGDARQDRVCRRRAVRRARCRAR